MAASYQAKSSQVLAAQLKVQELCVKASDSLVSVSGSDLLVNIGEPLVAAMAGLKQVAAGTLSGVVVTIENDADGKPTLLKIAGESAAAATTSFILKYTTKQ